METITLSNLLGEVRLLSRILVVAVSGKLPQIHLDRHVNHVPGWREGGATVPVELQQVGGLWDVETDVIPQLKILEANRKISYYSPQNRGFDLKASTFELKSRTYSNFNDISSFKYMTAPKFLYLIVIFIGKGDWWEFVFIFQ